MMINKKSRSIEGGKGRGVTKENKERLGEDKEIK